MIHICDKETQGAYPSFLLPTHVLPERGAAKRDEPAGRIDRRGGGLPHSQPRSLSSPVVAAKQT